MANGMGTLDLTATSAGAPWALSAVLLEKKVAGIITTIHHVLAGARVRACHPRAGACTPRTTVPYPTLSRPPSTFTQLRPPLASDVQIAYQRFWEGATQLRAMSSKLGDACVRPSLTPPSPSSSPSSSPDPSRHP